MRPRLFLCLVLLVSIASSVQAQQDGLLQINDPVHHFLFRQQVLGRLPHAHLSHQPLSAYEARRYLDSLATGEYALGRLDAHLLARYRGEAAGPGTETFRKVLPFTYRNGHDFLSAQGEEFGVQVNPLFYLSYGRARQSEKEGRETTIPVWQNTRGIRASGHVGKYIFFETRLEENQRRDARPAFGQDTAPRVGYTKFDRENLFYDYWIATGVVGFRSKFFEVRFGRDRNRWGQGRGSAMLSNYPTVYDQLQVRTTFWRVQYSFMFARLNDPLPQEIKHGIVPRKYSGFHRLALQLPGRIELEFFDSVIFGAPDTLGVRSGRFDMAYLNPIIFYRAVESDLVDPGSNPDNVLLGGGISWVAIPGLRLRTQLLIDELNFDQIGKGWWGNKWGWTAGLDLVDIPLKNLSLQLEYARLRPYLYGHQSSLTSFTHYNDLLGHPAGPNSEDFAFLLDYQPAHRWHAALTLAYTRRGRDTETEYYGRDPLRPYNDRVSDTGVELLQGVRQNLLLVEAHVGYELLPHVYLDAALRVESLDDAELGLDRYIAPSLMLRWGLPYQSVRY